MAPKTFKFKEIEYKLPSRKQEAFCREFLVDNNATQSAIRAGYSHKGARVQSSRMIAMPNIQAYIQKVLSDSGLTKEDIVQLLNDAITFNYSKIVEAVKCIEITDDNGVTTTTYEVDFDVIPEKQWKLLDVEFSPTKGLTIKSTKKMNVLDRLIKIHGYDPSTKHEHTIVTPVTTPKGYDLDAEIDEMVQK